jgi:hypothetical protein
MRPSRALAALAVPFVLALASCGGGAETQTGSQRAIPTSIADRLAALSESVASSWAAGDECGAAQQADALRHATDEAIASGAVPASYRDHLQSAVTNLQNTANCPEPAPPAAPEDNGKDKGKEKGKGEKKGHEKDEGGITSTTETTTEESD